MTTEDGKTKLLMQAHTHSHTHTHPLLHCGDQLALLWEEPEEQEVGVRVMMKQGSG